MLIIIYRRTIVMMINHLLLIERNYASKRSLIQYLLTQNTNIQKLKIQINLIKNMTKSINIEQVIKRFHIALKHSRNWIKNLIFIKMDNIKVLKGVLLAFPTRTNLILLRRMSSYLKLIVQINLILIKHTYAPT